MKRPPFAGLRSRLALLVFLAVLPALALTVFTGAEERRVVSASVQTRALDVVRRVSDDQRNLIETTRQVMAGIAMLPEVGQLRAPCGALLAAIIKQYPHYTNLGVADLDGNLVCSAVPTAQPANFSDRAWFQRALQTRDFAAGEYLIGRISGKSSLGLGFPLISEDQVLRGVLFVGLDLSWVNQLAAGAELPPGSALTVTDSAGTILARYPDPDRWVGQPVPEAPIVKTILATGRQGTAETAGADGVVRLYAFRALAETSGERAYVSVGIPRDAAYAEVDFLIARNAAGFIVVMMLALAATWFGGDLFVLRRINDLLRATKRLAAGDLGARTGLDYGHGEISQLARAFDDMAEALEKRDKEARAAEGYLRESEARFREMASSVPGIVFQAILRPDGSISFPFVSDGALEVSGVTPAEIQADASAIFSRVVEEDLEIVNRAIAESAQSLATTAIEFRLRHTNGQIRWVGTVATPHGLPDGSVQYNCVGIDLTDRKQAEEEVLRSEERYRSLFESNPHPMYAYDLETLSFVAVNDAAVRHYGYTRQEFLGMSLKDIRPPEDVPRLLEKVAELRVSRPARGLGWERGWRHCKKDGTIINVEITSHRVNFGERPAEIVLVDDVTERKRAEGALLESEKRFRALIEHSSDVVLLLSPGGTCLYASPSTTGVSGYSMEDFVGHNVFAMIHPDDLTNATALLADALAEPGRITRSELRAVNRKGGTAWIDIVARNLLDEPAVGAVVVNWRDITHRKRAEEALSESEERYRRLVELSPDGIAIHHEGTIVFVNTSGARLLGAGSPEDLVGKPVLDIVHPDHREIVSRRIRQLREADTEFPALERKMLRLDGTALDVEVRATPFHYQGKRAVQAVFHDITGRKRAQEQTLRHVQRLTALRHIDTLITSSLDLRVTLNVLLDQAITELRVDAASVLLFNQQTQRLEYAVGRGFRTRALQHTRLRLGEGHAGRAALERRVVDIPDLAAETGDLTRGPLLADELFVAYSAAPLVAKGQVRGVLETFRRSQPDPDPEWASFLEVLAGQAAVAIDNATLFEELQRSNTELTAAYDSTLEGWVAALDMRHKESEGHTRRVTEMATRLARAFGLGETEVAHIRRGALLHDIGKTGVPDSILLKPGPLTEEEWTVMRLHPVYARQFLSRISFLRPALDIPYCHHEKWDGSGYPRGLKAEEIPLAARIFAVVDVWDALRSDRVYRAAWQADRVLEHIRSLAGTHFDPAVVQVFLLLVEAEASTSRPGRLASSQSPGPATPGRLRLDP